MIIKFMAMFCFWQGSYVYSIEPGLYAQVIIVLSNRADAMSHSSSSAQRQKGLSGYCFKYVDRPFCLQTEKFQ